MPARGESKPPLYRAAAPPLRRCGRSGRVKALPAPPARLLRLRTGSLVLGLLILLGLVALVTRFGEISHFAELAVRIEPGWLAAGMALQGLTYVCEAQSWRATLRATGLELRLGALWPLSVAKLFSDQAMPSAGLSGTAFLLGALHRHGVSTAQAWACMLANVVAHYLAYLLVAWLSFALLAWHEKLNNWLLTTTLLVSAVAVGMPLLVLAVRRRGVAPGPALARRLPQLAQWLAELRAAPRLPQRTRVVARLVLLLAMIVVLDALTLWMMLRGIGEDVGVAAAFTCFVTASMVATLSLVPLGLGTFEAASVAMLHLYGIGIEAALAATILLRGLTLWLPMLPGFWLVRRELRGT